VLIANSTVAYVSARFGKFICYILIILPNYLYFPWDSLSCQIPSQIAFVGWFVNTFYGVLYNSLVLSFPIV
jgi:hypothetical protein